MLLRLIGTMLAVAAAVLVGLPWQSRSDVASAAPTMADGFLARGKIDTVVVVVMENRSFDNVFGGDVSVFGHPTPFPNANAAVPADIAGLMTTAPFAPDSGEDNWHNEFACLALGNFTSAQWRLVTQSPPPACFTPPVSPTVPPTQPFKYLDPHYRTVYSEIARKYTLGDAFYAVTSTDSYPAHQYIVAGQSLATYTDSNNNNVVQIIGGQFSGGNGCADARATYPPYVTAPVLPTPQPGVTVGPAFTTQATTGVAGECYDVPTFADAILATQPAPISWGNFATVDDPGVFNGFHNIKRWWGMQWPASGSNVLFVAKNGALPNFSWVKPPCIDASDHPDTGNGGPAWVRDLVNAIGSTSGKRNDQWSRTAIFVVWDDWGGFYDHVVPPAQRQWDNLGPGFRTPFLLISPYSRPGVIHSPATYGSVLRFVEDLYGVPSLNTVDANSPDLTGYFDFTLQPRRFDQLTSTTPESWQAACQFTTFLDRD